MMEIVYACKFDKNQHAPILRYLSYFFNSQVWKQTKLGIEPNELKRSIFFLSLSFLISILLPSTSSKNASMYLQSLHQIGVRKWHTSKERGKHKLNKEMEHLVTM